MQLEKITVVFGVHTLRFDVLQMCRKAYLEVYFCLLVRSPRSSAGVGSRSGPSSRSARCERYELLYLAHWHIPATFHVVPRTPEKKPWDTE